MPYSYRNSQVTYSFTFKRFEKAIVANIIIIRESSYEEDTSKAIMLVTNEFNVDH